MKIDCVLVACNENLHYLRFWPLVRKAWKTFLQCDVKMVYIGLDYATTELKADPDVFIVDPIPTWPTATQAQCIRLLYPGLLEYSGAVLISDMDMIPLQTAFFQNGFEAASSDQFVSLRGIDETYKIVYMCYVGACPSVWKSMFPVETVDDVRNTLTAWSKKYWSDGKHAGSGWGTDQDLLYAAVKAFPKTHLLPNCDIQRLDRISDAPFYIHNFTKALQTDLADQKFIDFHMPPYLENASLIQTAFQIAVHGMHS